MKNIGLFLPICTVHDILKMNKESGGLTNAEVY